MSGNYLNCHYNQLVFVRRLRTHFIGDVIFLPLKFFFYLLFFSIKSNFFLLFFGCFFTIIKRKIYRMNYNRFVTDVAIRRDETTGTRLYFSKTGIVGIEVSVRADKAIFPRIGSNLQAEASEGYPWTGKCKPEYKLEPCRLIAVSSRSSQGRSGDCRLPQDCK